jgi:hypothetical protein
MQSTIEERLGFTSEPPKDLGFQDIVLDTVDVQKAAKESLDFLAALALPTVFKYLFPAVFQAIWQWLLSFVHKFRDFSQLVIGLPRGFGKTMLIKIFVLYCILFTKKQFILIICGTQGKANNIIADVTGMLNEANIRKVFGDWKLAAITDRQDLKRFGFRGRNIILMGAGAGSDIRGITLENERPDVMIFDDIQTKEDSESETISSQLETWLYGTAMKAKSPHGCLFIFIANMYPTKWSLLRRLKANPTWDKFIAGGILADGSSLWEELQPIEQLMKEFERDLSAGHPEIFYSEVLNDEHASTNYLLDLSKLPLPPMQEEDLHLGNFIIIDPSNDKANSDAVSLGYFEVFENIELIPVPVMQEAKEGRLSPLDTIEAGIEIALRRNCRLIAIEANAYQYSLKFWFDYICLQRGIAGIEAVPIYSGALSKPTRIMNMFKELAAGELFLAKVVRSLVDLQIIAYKPLRRDNTDGLLDLLAYANKVLGEFKEFIETALTINMQDYQAIKVLGPQQTSGF